MPKLYLMLGYPGAGKTTTAEVIHDLTDAIHLSSDKTRLELFHPPMFDQSEHDELYRQLDATTEKLLAEGKDVIYDANLNRLQHRQEKYDICNRTGSTPVLVWVQTAKVLARRRATETNRSHLAPQDETLDQMFERIAGIIEEPGPDEPYVAVDGTKVSASYIKQQLSL